MPLGVTAKVDRRAQGVVGDTDTVAAVTGALAGAVYGFDAQGQQNLFYSKIGYLDGAHNPLSLPYNSPVDCHHTTYVMSGNQTIRQTLPEGFQRAEFLLEHGMVDLITPRAEMKPAISRFLKIFTGK